MPIENDCHEANAADEVFVSTDLVEAGIRDDFWREVTRPFYETTPLAGSDSQQLEGAIRAREVAGLWMGSITFNAQRYNRDRRIIASSDLDQYLVAVVAGGGMSGDFAGTGVAARSGDIVVLDLTQPLQSDVTAGGMFSTLIPREILAKATGHSNLHGLILKAHLPMTKLLTAYLRGLGDLGNQSLVDEAAAVQEALVTILAAALRAERPDRGGELRPLSAALRQRVLDFIDGNINNPNLGPEFILQRFHVSRAHLYRAFAGDGGVSSVIRDRRLDAAYLELTRTGISGRSIAEIAFSLGFTDSTHFLRRFRARFGRTPSEVRREGASRRLASDLQGHFREFRKRAQE